ncbi:MAG: DHA2 family efflux MFS transporter permease subunit [Acidobacteriota bacterium]
MPLARCDPASRRWVLAATILGSSMAFIDGTAINVALPVLQRSLGTSVAGAQWVVEAYALFLSALVLVGGSLSDRVGRRRIFSTGAVVFAASSLACGLAPGVSSLIAARAVQGVGAALLVPSSLAILGAAFSPEDRGRAVGTWSALTAIAAAVGPAMGGLLVQAVSWRAVFFLNLPIASAVLWITARRVPESRNPAAGRLDLVGALLATAGLGALTFGLIEAPAAGWSDPRVWGSVSAGAAALAAFLALERRASDPMVPPRLFRIRSFAAANLLTFFLYAALSAALFFLPFDLIQARGYSPSAAGAAVLPLVLVISLLSRWSGAAADRVGSRLPLTIGPVVAAAGFLLLGMSGRFESYASSLLPALSILGLGMAITVAPLTTAVLNAAGRGDAGAASGINNAVARVASLLAIAVFGILATATFDRSLDWRLDRSGISPRAREAVSIERSKLGAITPPAGLPAAEAGAIEDAVRTSLASSFRTVVLGCAALALLASACAAWGLRGVKGSPPSSGRESGEKFSSLPPRAGERRGERAEFSIRARDQNQGSSSVGP